ncbi:DUF2958 domain-containing protein [Segnochrobactraceae bacterium EtOH-i3]
MTAALITNELYARLLASGARSAAGEDIAASRCQAHHTGRRRHLASHRSRSRRPRLSVGLCDLGLGEPELGYVSLAEIRSVRGRLRLPVERDLYFKAEHPLSWYALRARQSGRIVTA